MVLERVGVTRTPTTTPGHIVLRVTEGGYSTPRYGLTSDHGTLPPPERNLGVIRDLVLSVTSEGPTSRPVGGGSDTSHRWEVDDVVGA